MGGMDDDRYNRRVYGYWWRALLWQGTMLVFRRHHLPGSGVHRHPPHHWYH